MSSWYWAILIAIIASFIAVTLLIGWFVFISPATRALMLVKLWYNARVAWRRFRRSYNKRRGRKTARGRSHKRTLLSSNLFWLVAVLLVAAGLVFGTEMTLVAWWPSKETWGKIGFWTLIALGVAAVAAILWFLKDQGYLADASLRNNPVAGFLGGVVKLFAGVAAGILLLYFGAWFWNYLFPPGKPANEIVVTREWSEPIQIPLNKRALRQRLQNVAYEVMPILYGKELEPVLIARDPVPDERTRCERDQAMRVKGRANAYRLRIAPEETTITMVFQIGAADIPAETEEPCYVAPEVASDDVEPLEDGIPADEKEEPEAQPQDPLPTRPLIPPLERHEPLPSRPIAPPPFRFTSRATS